MIVWRSYRLLRRRICALHNTSARQPTAPHIPLSISGFRLIRSQTSDAATGTSPKNPSVRLVPLHRSASATETSLEKQSFKRFVTPTNRNDLASWVALLEPFLPGRLRNPPQEGEEFSHHADDIITLSLIISEARRQSNHDILVHIALQQRRWEAMLWIAQTLIESCNPSSTFALGPDGLSTVAWPMDAPLDLITLTPFYFENEASHTLAFGRRLRTIAPIRSPSLTNFVPTKANFVIGQIWQSLGRLVINAASCEDVERENIMSHVFRILAALNTHRFLSNTNFSPKPNDDPSALQQPLLLQNLSREMLTSLSEIDRDVPNHAFEQVSTQSHNSLASVGSPNIVSPSSHRFSTGLWLDFILWCCVHGQWILEGASIVTEMRKVFGPNRWSLVCWGDNGPPDSLDAAGKHAISVEVVVALVDGLVAISPKKGDPTAPSVVNIVDKLFVLKGMLGRDNMGLGFSTWDSIISRFADSPALLSPEKNPGVMEIILGLSESYGKEPNSRNATSYDADSLENSRSYVFDASAAVIGLYHRTLHAFIRSRDVEGALRVWGRLQAFTDTNKARSLREFFAKLISTRLPENPIQSGELREIRRDLEAVFPGVEFPAYFPQIPKPIMADLLDLMVESGNLELASWMVYSGDLDGPLIPETLYADQVMAPSLIRYAAVANDTELLKRLSGAETARLSGKTLVALCDNRIQSVNFPAALDILSTIYDYSFHEWTSFDLATLTKSLILQMFGPRNSRSPDDPLSKDAAALLQRLFRGDFGRVWGPSYAQLDTMVGILSSLDPYLSALCSHIVKSGDNFRIDIPTDSFNVLLEGITRVWGCHKGKEVYMGWCTYKKDRHISDLKGYEGEQLPTVLELFSGLKQVTTPDPEPEDTKILFRGEITPNIATVRVIIQDALVEVQDDSDDHVEAHDTDKSSKNDKTPAHEVLQWAQTTLIQDYGLSDIDVDYELQGYFSLQQHGDLAEALYSRQTLRIWTAFAGSYRAWALAKENELRVFAWSKTERQLVVDAQSPAERLLLQSLANDYRLLTELSGDEPELGIRVFKADYDPRVPLKTVDEALERVRRW